MSQQKQLDRPTAQPATSTGTRVRIVTQPSELRAEVDAWHDLVRAAAEPNSFYEPWFFLPAAEQLGQQEDWHIAIVETGDAHESSWLGFFPLVRHSSGWGGPSWLSMWNHPQCLLSTPLVRKDSIAHAMQTLLGALHDDSNAPGILEFPQFTANGEVQQALVDIERDLLLTRFVRSTHNRALLSRKFIGDASDKGTQYVADSLGGHHMRELRRQRRRLSDQGDLELRVLKSASQLELWSDWFLDLENSGWKGRSGTSMKQHPKEEIFFRETVSLGFAAQRLEMLGLFCKGEPIAMKCNLLADHGSFSFKIAFNEDLGRFSPGVQLELDHIATFAASGREWMDSCAVAEHKMINRLWSDRRPIQDLFLSTGRASSELWLASAPLLRVLYRQFKNVTAAAKKLIPLSRSTNKKS